MLYLPQRSTLLFIVFILYCFAASICVIEGRDIGLDERFKFLFLNSEPDVFSGIVIGNEMNMAHYYLLARPFAPLGGNAIKLRYISMVPALATILPLYWFCRWQYLLFLELKIDLSGNKTLIRPSLETALKGWAG